MIQIMAPAAGDPDRAIMLCWDGCAALRSAGAALALLTLLLGACSRDRSAGSAERPPEPPRLVLPETPPDTPALAIVPDAAARVARQVPQPEGPRQWRGLAEDGLHDPRSPSLDYLQSPAEALAALPAAAGGNQVDWVTALEDGSIRPRASVDGAAEQPELALDIIRRNTRFMPFVRFPHRQHAAWLDCANCHDALFERRAGAARIDMRALQRGEYCGRCHGTVAFPLDQCRRCHSVSRYDGLP